MNPTIQPGMHPDAESLTAFAEQVLPVAEREEILVHMSTCGRCREVVFLAQQAIEEDQPEPVAAAVDAPIKARASWFNWRWAWIPVAACAGLIGVAVMQHSRRTATETQTATNVAPTDSLQTERSPKAETQKQTTQNEPRQAKPAKQSDIVAEREIVPQALRRDEAKSLLDDKKPSDQKDVGARATVPAIVLAPGVSGGSTHAMMAARAKTSAIGGPLAADQFQQQNMANQQNMLQSSGAQLAAANKPVNAATAPRAESETVSVQAQSVIPAQQPAPAATPEVSAIATTEQSDAISLAGAAGFSKKEKASLPNGLGTLSVASSGERTIALDTKGVLFVSEDGGKHWKPVRTQWTGRAVLVRSLNTAAKGNALGAPGAMKMSPTEKFELVTDDLQTWVSADGTIWTVQAMPGK